MWALFISVFSGTLLTYLYEREASLPERICTGCCTGIALSAALGFVWALCFGMLSASAVLLTAGFSACALLVLLKPTCRQTLKSDLKAAASGLQTALTKPRQILSWTALLYAFLFFVVWLVFERAMFVRAGEIYTGIVHNVGDLPFHLQVIASFAYGHNFPPQHPEYAGARFVYPFLADFATAMWIRAGSALSRSVFAQSILLSFSFVVLMRRFTWELTRNRTAANLAPLLVLLSGGLGWVLLFKDLAGGEQGIAAVLMHLPRSYTIASDTTWRWPNSLTALLLTQRSLLLGLPLALCIFLQWFQAGADRSRNDGEAGSSGPARARMIAAGVFAGLLPLVHGHSFLVVMGVAAWFAVTSRKWRLWASFFVVAVVLAAPQIWWMAQRSSTDVQSFLGWSIGWDHGSENIAWFWLKNTGIFIPLLLAAIVWRDKSGKELLPERAWRFYFPFLACFVVPNLVRLAPWVWDNIKVLFYWYVASVPAVALLLARLWDRGKMPRAAAAAMTLAMTLAGGLDVWRVISGASEYREFDRDGISMAARMRGATEPNAVVLHAPVYNSAVFLTGRRSLLGYAGTMWTHGLTYMERESDIRRMYLGGPDASRLLERYGVNYVLVGPVERSFTPVNSWFFERYRKVGESGAYRLYAVNANR